MEGCVFCQIAENKIGAKKVHEDNEILAIMHPSPAGVGHIVVMPKKHYNIIEQIPDYEVGALFNIANKISSAVFEALGVQGTNIIVQNGVAAGQRMAHFSVNIIPRRENDGLGLQWKPKQLDEEEMSTVELRLKSETERILSFEKEKPKPREEAEKKKEVITENKDKENYLIRQLNRLP